MPCHPQLLLDVDEMVHYPLHQEPLSLPSSPPLSCLPAKSPGSSSHDLTLNYFCTLTSVRILLPDLVMHPSSVLIDEKLTKLTSSIYKITILLLIIILILFCEKITILNFSQLIIQIFLYSCSCFQCAPVHCAVSNLLYPLSLVKFAVLIQLGLCEIYNFT